MKTARALLVGKDQAVLNRLLSALRSDGHAVEGTVMLATVHQDFDARNFTLIGLGAGFNDQERTQLLQGFQLQDPDVRLEDVFGPVGLAQLQFLLSPAAQQSVLERLTVLLAEVVPEVQLTVRTPTKATITLYHFQGQLRAEELWQGELPAGLTRLPLRREQLLPGMLYHVVAQLPEGEVHTYRFTMPGVE
ncbi:hypothetical protein [Hymenobacter sp. YC55]|uniref:hypothetical protein n=1 Tax=Hymenobacter sp. YC55 TaxID=3034019 RepID=UPI0023F7F68B|nr:hypothetical protein [Hymenobacter sp. YC55]MDF7811959.1 hypothetical protein [Hymenobacter sp. YC55]